MVGNLCYIGSTKDIDRRMYSHKYACCNEKNKDYNLKLYKTIREHYGDNWDNVNWSVIDCYYNVSIDFRNEIEQYYIELFKSELNMRSVNFIGMKEYYNENKEHIIEYQKQWYNENKEQINERHRQYRIKNKEKIKEINKQWYIKNREKINEKITCGCGSTYTRQHKKRHENSKKHQDYLSTII